MTPRLERPFVVPPILEVLLELLSSEATTLQRICLYSTIKTKHDQVLHLALVDETDIDWPGITQYETQALPHLSLLSS